MPCFSFDVRGYFFEEMDAGGRQQVEAHLRECAGCRDELERLRATGRALLRLKDEEMPRRIAFVSDKIFEPSGVARWWAAIAGGMPRFAGAAALVLAVFFLGAWISRPSVTVESGRWQIAFGSDAGVQKAMAVAEARHAADMRDVAQAYELLVRQMNVLYRQSVELQPAAFRQ